MKQNAPPKNQRKNGRHHRPFSASRAKKLLRPFSLFRLHPLFLAVGVFYAVKGELFLFLITTIVALQHECAHAFAAAKLGYKLRSIVLMPFGAVIDGDLSSISLKDEVFVALCGPLCNLATAAFFVALWWLAPTMYAFTDVACYSSLAIALVNLLPAYPLDGGRILRCHLAQIFKKYNLNEQKAEARATKICRIVTLLFSAALLTLFVFQCVKRTANFSILIFAFFLLLSAVGNVQKTAVYQRIDFSAADVLKKGAKIRRVAVLDSCPIKDVFRYIEKGSYLVLEVYDEAENHLFNLSQNQLSQLFLHAKTPYDPLRSFYSNE